MNPPEPTIDDAKPRPRGRRKWKRWVLLAGVVGGLVWLNGPGLRWLGPVVAGHFLQKSGLRGSFELDGSLTGGISVKDLLLESDGPLARLTVGRLTPDYRLLELFKGRLDGIEVDGLHAELKLGLEGEPEKKKDPFDLNQLLATLRTVRGAVIRMEADLENVSLNATHHGKRVISLARTRIRHQAGAPDVDLEIGAITDASGHEWPARESSVVWNEDDLRIDRLDPLPGMSVRGLVVALPASGGPSAEAELHIDGAVFLVNASPGFSSVQAHLREGRLRIETLAGHFGLKLPAGGELSSLSMNVERLLPDPKAATGALRVLLEQVVYEDWKVPELSLDATLDAARATVAAHGVALDSGFSLNGEAGVGRSEGGFRLGETRGHFNIEDVAALVAALADRVEAIDPAAAVPESVVEGGFQIAWVDNRPASAEVELRLKPAEPEAATMVAVKGRWQPGEALSGELAVDGAKATASYDSEAATYQGRLDFEGFKSGRIDPWLVAFKAGTRGAVSLTGHWQGAGSVKERAHRGALTIDGADLTREGVPPVHAQGGIDYDWPKGFTTRDLQLKAAAQIVTGDLQLAEGFLHVSDLLWRDGETEMAAGRAKLPVPEDVSKWREMLAGDERPLAVSVQSKVLALESLKDWMPAAAKLDPRSTGRIELSVSGTYAEPVVDAVVDVRDLRSPEQPDLPAADLVVKLAAGDGHVSMEGKATAKDFPPAVITASMRFRPAEWAEKPGLVLEEKVSARVDLPGIDLSRFATVVPGLRKMSGAVTGNIEVAGEIGAPEVKGAIVLTGGGFEFETAGIPAVSGLGASVGLTLDRITLKELKATVAGGKLSASGTLEIVDGKPGALDFQLKGDHLPLKRDEALIVRANAGLRLAGSWEQASLTGSIGVVDSIFFKDIELLPIGSPFTAPSAASLPKIDVPVKPAETIPEPFRNWAVDVVVKTENPFLIRGNLATGKVQGKLRVGGTLGNPAPDGEVRISDLVAALPFSTLRVPRGTLRFTAETGFDPILELRGNAEPRPYQVSVYVYGRASDPQLILTSSPPLPENEIMTLLATGTTTTGLEDPQAASSRALQLFAEELRRGRFGVGKQLRPLLKLLDRVDFSLAEADPYSSELFSTATLRLTDRWFLSAGMGDEGDSRVLAIWRLRFY